MLQDYLWFSFPTLWNGNQSLPRANGPSSCQQKGWSIMTMARAKQGDRIKGRYEIVEILRRGDLNSVYLCREAGFEHCRVLKEIWGRSDLRHLSSTAMGRHHPAPISTAWEQRSSSFSPAGSRSSSSSNSPRRGTSTRIFPPGSTESSPDASRRSRRSVIRIPCRCRKNWKRGRRRVFRFGYARRSSPVSRHLSKATNLH
jgi:hypothetical protein